MLRGTPFHSRNSALCQAHNWRRWSGYVVAGSYELTHEWEYYAIRSAAALIDVSPLFKYMVRGPDASRFLNRVVTRDVFKCRLNQVMYTPWCDEAGKVIDDGTISRLDDDVFRLTSAEPNLRWLHDNAIGLEVSIEDVSDVVAALSLQGPTSRAVLSHVTDVDLDPLRYYHVTPARIRHISATISRTGYTGDLGYEIWIDAKHAEALWDILVEVGTPHGLRPTGLLAMDVARIEAGLLLIAVDYISAHKGVIESQKSTPFELGLGWTVKLDKDYLLGRGALEDEKRRGSAWRFRGLEIDWDSLEGIYGAFGLPPQLPTTAWRTSVPVYSNGTQVGYATSGCWSPILKKYIALAHLQSEYAALGTNLQIEVTAEHHRKRAAARVVKHSFFNPPRKRE